MSFWSKCKEFVKQEKTFDKKMSINREKAMNGRIKEKCTFVEITCF